ncbi:MAG: hypothetical protein ACPGO3_05160 [Magnetospiraceae bacterium]
MDASLVAYLSETANELIQKADGMFPAMADDMYLEASELMALASKLMEKDVAARRSFYQQAA